MIDIETIKQMFRAKTPPEPSFYLYGHVPVYVIEEPPEIWIFTDQLVGDD